MLIPLCSNVLDRLLVNFLCVLHELNDPRNVLNSIIQKNDSNLPEFSLNHYPRPFLNGSTLTL
jgi:hypothetical protein